MVQLINLLFSDKLFLVHLNTFVWMCCLWENKAELDHVVQGAQYSAEFDLLHISPGLFPVA